MAICLSVSRLRLRSYMGTSKRHLSQNKSINNLILVLALSTSIGAILCLGVENPVEVNLEGKYEVSERHSWVDNSLMVKSQVHYPDKSLGVLTSNYYYLLLEYDWCPDTMYRIMRCESRFNPSAHNFSHRTKDDSWGLLQINLYGNLKKERPSAEWLLIPENNIEFAYKLWISQGYNAWRNCL